MQHTFKLRMATLVFASLAMAVIPNLAWALGLGEIQSDTRIGQSFSAKIPILNASSGELQGLSVSLADHAAYQSANISEPDYLFSLKFSVAQGPHGSYIQVTSNKPVKLPFLNLLIRASWPSGQVTRQYTVLMNPPTFVSGSGAQQQVSTPSTPTQSESVPVQQAAQQPTTTKPMSPPVTAASAASATGSEQPVQQTTRVASLPSSYTVHRGDTLWGIARQLHNGTEASVNQTMIAIYQANPQAFHGNINRLDAGSTLKVPTQSEIAQVEAEEATRLVTRQNDAWRGAGAAPRTAANNSVPEQQQPVPATTGQAASENAPPQPVVAPTSSSASTQAAGEPAAKPATSGRVVLTTPEVTAATSVAAAPGSSAAASTAIAGAAGAMGTTQKTQASATHSAAAGMAGTGASTGGPMKVQNNAMAGMAAAKQPVTASKAATTLPSQKPKLKTPNSVNSVNSVNASGQQQSSGLMYWLGRPVGWIVIAAIILILIAIVLLILRQRRNAAEQPVPLVVPGGEHETDEHGNESVVDNEESDLETKENLEDIGIATYIGGSSLDVNKVDAMDEADLHVGFGEYGKAAQILRAGIERQPQRKELRRKLLDVLFAASESSAFAAEARNYKKEVAGAADWQAVAAMGRQLCPQDEFFKDGGTTAGNAGTSEGDDFANLDLDRLARDEDDGKEQDEFERTMDELSTFIETYVPASTETPVALQLPPDEVASEEPAKSEADAESAPEDEPIDFHLDDEDLPPVASETMPEGAEEDEAENMVDTKLDLARAYIDMGDTDSARGVLEEVIDEGDEKQSDEARRLLEDLD